MMGGFTEDSKLTESSKHLNIFGSFTLLNIQSPKSILMYDERVNTVADLEGVQGISSTPPPPPPPDKIISFSWRISRDCV